MKFLCFYLIILSPVCSHQAAGKQAQQLWGQKLLDLWACRS